MTRSSDQETWTSRISELALLIHIIVAGVAVLVTETVYLQFPNALSWSFITSEYPTLLTAYITFLGLFLAVAAFYVAFVESKRASLLSLKIAGATPDFAKELIDEVMGTYRRTANLYLQFVKAAVATFAIIILVIVYGYAVTGTASSPEPISIAIAYFGLSAFLVAVSDVMLTVLFFKF